LTLLAESVAEIQWQRVRRLGGENAARWKLSLTILESATESLQLPLQSRSQRVGWEQRVVRSQRVTWAQSVSFLSGRRQHTGSSPLRCWPLRPNLCDELCIVGGRDSVAESPSSGRGGEAARWKLSLTILDSMTESLQLALQSCSVAESHLFSRRESDVWSQSFDCLSVGKAAHWKLSFWTLQPTLYDPL